MTGERLAQMGWPYAGQPINVDFDVNWSSPQSRGLVAWWPMIGNQGGWPVPDRAFHRYPMAAFNTPTWVSDAARGWSVLFDDGALEYLEIDRTPLTAVPLTMSAWVYSDSATSLQSALWIGDLDVTNRMWSLELAGNAGGDPAQFFIRGSTGVTATVQTTTGYSVNTWHHICGVSHTVASHACFIDGGSKTSDVTNAGVITADRVAIGRRADSSPGNYFSGRIADVRIYSRALADAEVYNQYANPWELYAPRIWQQRAYVAAVPTGAPILTTYSGYSVPVG